MRKKSHYILLLLCLLSSSILFGQESEKYRGDYATFYRGERLFEKGQFGAAAETFATFMKTFNHPQDPQYEKARYYKGLSALELYNRDAVTQLLSFINDYPESIYRNTIYFKLGSHFYQKKKYKDAKKWLEETDITKLDSTDLPAYHFKLGYSDFQLGENKVARNEFYEIKGDTSSNFGAPALYYYSYIEYRDGGLQEALNGFLKLRDNSTFANEVKKYIIQIYYLLGDYEKVTEYAPEFSSKDGIKKNTAEMNLIIGKAYYNVGKYDEAATFLEDYYQRSVTTRQENYALGYSYLKIKDYKAAIQMFDRVTQDKKDTLSQISFYHIAEAYIADSALNNARTAFKSAADISADPNIQEDALYHYAVLSYKLDYNPYGEAIKAFELFLNKFPNSKRKEDVYNYLVNVYTSTKNYKEALASIDKVKDKNVKLKMTYQIVSYNMGVSAYEKGNYTACIQDLNGVFKYNILSSVAGKAKFWQADANYMLQKWTAAIEGYREFLGVPGVTDQKLKEAAYYNIAYAYFMQKDWTQAIAAFRSFTQLNNIQDKTKLADAYIRLGDCYYTKSNPDFAKSVEYYKKSLDYDSKKKDKVLFSLARVYKLMPGERDKEIKTLNQLLDQFPHSSFEIKAIFELGDANKNIGNYSDALLNYQKIVNDFPNNIIVKDALIGIGDVKFKQAKYKESESYFNRVLKEYSLDNETCKSVTQSLIDIYRVTRHQEKITALGEKYPCAGVTKNDEEVFYYETASKLYVNKKYDEALPEIYKYLEHYPNGQFTTQLTAYLANIYYDKDQKDSAIANYEKVINYPQSTYTEQALVRTSKYFYNAKDYEKALPYYEQLEKIASNPNVLFNTEIGLMRTNFLLENYVNAANAAVKVLGNDLLNEKSIKIEANYIAGMAYFNIKDYQKALTYLRWTADNTGKERGTEALYCLSESYFGLQNYSKAETIHKELMKRKPAYDYWIAKSLILQARVFQNTGDLFQAEQTINLVISNYPNKNDDILKEADKVKVQILNQKNQPKDIENDSIRTININNGGNE